MILAAAVCPHPPLLLAESGRVDPIADLRASILAALMGLDSAAADELVLIGGSDSMRSSPRVGSPAEPLSIRVGRGLLADAGLSLPVRQIVVSASASCAEAAAIGSELAGSAERVVVLVMADGTARRLADGGPGTFDQRAEAFDAAIVDALESGNPTGLAALDPTLAEDLMVAGRAALQVLAGVQAPSVADVHYAAAPYGVGYVVATWLW